MFLIHANFYNCQTLYHLATLVVVIAKSGSIYKIFHYLIGLLADHSELPKVSISSGCAKKTWKPFLFLLVLVKWKPFVANVEDKNNKNT